MITKEIAAKVLATVDAGLANGLGQPSPGYMCVEAAVCYALGQEHGDEPDCVSAALRAFKVELNDAAWSSPKSRAKGLRRLALIQLDSAGHLDDCAFAAGLIDLASQWASRAASAASAAAGAAARAASAAADAYAADAARAAASAARAAAYTASAAASAATYAADAAAYAASAATYAATYAADAAARDARDAALSAAAEDVVQLLIRLKVPGVRWLELAPYGCGNG